LNPSLRIFARGSSKRGGPTKYPAPHGNTGRISDYIREICRYWCSECYWIRQVKLFSSFQHYRYMNDGFGIHFHERGKGAHPIPLILTHGWPGSFVEMRRIIPLLIDAFDVVVTSLPGFGFLGPAVVAEDEFTSR
jgi:hypothetical protein